MIDLHCHLHPGVDDGPIDDDETLALARALVGAGVTVAACTSHVRPDKAWDNDLPGAAARHARLAALLEGAAVPLRCVRGAEHYIHEEVFADLDGLSARAVPYGDSRWLLVECPYTGPPPDLLGLLWGIRRRGFKVLLAHVERYPYVWNDEALLERLQAAGHLIQVNLGSLAGVYDRVHQKAAQRLLKAGRVAVLAGDCHTAADVARNIDAGLVAARKLVGPDAVQRLTVDAPALILEDASPERIWP